MRPSWLPRPSAGNTSEIADSSRKIATTARNCGNIWMSMSESRPMRRPRKRIRENAYAAMAPRNTVHTPVTRPMTIELRNQSAKGWSGFVNRAT